ncbi:MAG: hypothetical protein JJT94_11795 [Bernardetiaceae bacterium]|nr:hypothetical protein [Bernardetiaceae bacterium]
MENIKLHVTGADDTHTLQEAQALRNWIADDESIEEFESVALERKALQPDEAGGMLEGILAITLGAPAIVQLVRSIHVWLKQKGQSERAKKLLIDVELPNGSKFKLDASQMSKDENELVKEVLAMMQQQQQQEKSKED